MLRRRLPLPRQVCIQLSTLREYPQQWTTTTIRVQREQYHVSAAAAAARTRHRNANASPTHSAWISLSSSVILFNKWILSTAKFNYPIVLTTWHLTFATVMTQLMARFTKTLDSRKNVPMNGRVYLRTIVPIGVMFSLSLICGNLTYLYLSVSFIQMLKVSMIFLGIFGRLQPNHRGKELERGMREKEEEMLTDFLLTRLPCPSPSSSPPG